LSKQNLYEILDLLLAQVRLRLEDQQISLEVSNEARDFLLKVGYDEEYGARPLRRAIQSHVDDILADALLAEEIAQGQTVRIELHDDKLVVVPQVAPQPLIQ
jgi:ATP-dependent Clp protease ATP-binding subunit ClpC